MYKSIILPSAKQDIKESAQWYNKKQRGLGKRFISYVRKKVKFICQNPTATAVRYNNTRCAVLDVFPFMLYYSIDEEQELVIVSAVLHTSRGPERWEGQ